MLVDQNPDDIINICKRLGSHDEISTLPNGYDTIMDGNCTLSTSAKQILAIARILLKNSRILVFDEALGILDETSQNKVLAVATGKSKKEAEQKCAYKACKKLGVVNE